MEKNYRVTRFPKSSGLADEVALLCTKSNGRDLKLSIADLEGYVACAMILYPSTNSGVVVSRISDYHLIIDQDSQPLLEVVDSDIIENPIMDIYDQSSN
jgi:hypothetical protein